MLSILCFGRPHLCLLGEAYGSDDEPANDDGPADVQQVSDYDLDYIDPHQVVPCADPLDDPETDGMDPQLFDDDEDLANDESAAADYVKDMVCTLLYAVFMLCLC